MVISEREGAKTVFILDNFFYLLLLAPVVTFYIHEFFDA